MLHLCKKVFERLIRTIVNAESSFIGAITSKKL